MKELEDLKKKHKLKDDFLEPKQTIKRNYGAKGKSEPLLGSQKPPAEIEVLISIINRKKAFLLRSLVFLIQLK